jgi:serine/threonine-protein kinase
MAGTRRSPSRDDEPTTGETGLHAAVDQVVRAVAHAPPCPPPPDPESGTRWGERGRYVIERRLGRGGMGTVYLATDTLLGRHVALKVLDAGETAEEDARRARLLREARLAAGLEHERIARVYDVGEHDGSTFVAMEYVRGANLRAWMAEPHEPSEVLAVLAQIAEGLSVLHGSGVIHRDLKPENVMLPAQGGVKLLDFGLAGHITRPAEATASADDGTGTASRSASAFFGTPGYMAPEQYLGERADARADVFALGVMIVELVTGERPFKGGTLGALFKAVLEQPRRLEGSHWERYPARLGEVALRMLEREKESRYVDGAGALEALKAVVAAPVVTVAPAQPAVDDRPKSPSRRVWWLAAGGVVAVAVAAVAGPRVSKVLALRRTLAKTPPLGMVLVNEAVLTVGQSADTARRQCDELGSRCNPRLMNYQVPEVRVSVPPFYLDTREVSNRDMVAMLNKLQGQLHVEADEDDHSLRYVRFNAGLDDKGKAPLLDLHPARGGIEYSLGHDFSLRPGREDWPANQVSWFGARLYCSTMGKRLPTENEWEAAARGAGDRPFPWGTDAPRCGAVAVPSDGFLPMAPGCSQLESPFVVASAAQDVTPTGIHDLGGNVTEWVDAVYVEGDRGSVLTDPNAEMPRVLRGGSFFFSLLSRTSVRNKRPPSYMAYDVGFRCAANTQSETTERKD